MKKIFLGAYIFSFFISLLFAETSNFKVSFIAGEFYLKSHKAKTWKKGSVGDIMRRGFLLKTGPKSEVTLINNNETIKIKANTLVRLDDLYNSSNREKVIQMSNMKSRLFKVFLEKKNFSKVTKALGVRGDETGSSPEISWSDDLNQESSPKMSLIDRAGASYSEESYSETISLLKSNLSTFADNQKEEALYMMGASYFNLGLFEKSIVYLERIQKSRTSDIGKVYSSHFLIAIAYSYLGENNISKSYLRSFVKKYPNNKLVPDAYYMLASIYRLEGKTQEAKKFYEIIINKYPESDVFNGASKDILELRK